MKSKVIFTILTIIFAAVACALKSMTAGIATMFCTLLLILYFICYLIAGFGFAKMPKKAAFDYVLYFIVSFLFLFSMLVFVDGINGKDLYVVSLFPEKNYRQQHILYLSAIVLDFIFLIGFAVRRKNQNALYAKNVILIHGINGIPKMFEWLKGRLEDERIEVIMPSFPPQEGTVYEDWAKIFNQYIDKIKPGSTVVCHSIGNEFLIRYLADKNLKIHTYVSLAGFAKTYHNEGKDVLNAAVERFLVNQEQINQFKALTKKRYSIYSDDDHIVPFDVLEEFPRQIDAEPKLIRGIGHMGKKSGLEKFPELFDLVLSDFFRSSK